MLLPIAVTSLNAFSVKISKTITHGCAAAQLSPRSPPFAIRGAPAPLLAHAGACHKVFPSLASKLAVGSDF
jgi:hypothetical protein